MINVIKYTKVIFYHLIDLNGSRVNPKITLYSDFVLEIIPGRQHTHGWLYQLFSIMSKHLHFLYI